MRDLKVDINSNALQREILKRFPTQKEAANKIKRGDSYFSNVITRGKISEIMADVIEEKLKIPKETYVIQEKDNYCEKPQNRFYCDSVVSDPWKTEVADALFVLLARTERENLNHFITEAVKQAFKEL